ncbi:SLOG family protein [Methylocystis sp.]|uniref:SLOG family protein n=1 Tax=Methylocystis sp. TaxID=1911079 RepID=UPI003DA53A7F
MIDSRDFLNAKKLAEAQLPLASGHRIAFAGGDDCNGHQRIWDALDKLHAKHPDVVLLRGGDARRDERITPARRIIPKFPISRSTGLEPSQSRCALKRIEGLADKT